MGKSRNSRRGVKKSIKKKNWDPVKEQKKDSYQIITYPPKKENYSVAKRSSKISLRNEANLYLKHYTLDPYLPKADKSPPLQRVIESRRVFAGFLLFHRI